MESGKKDDFLVTHWPGQPVPVPQVLALPVTLTRAGYLEFSWPTPKLDHLDPMGWRSHLTNVPGELYLRGFLDLNLQSPEAIADFSQRHGQLEASRWRDLPADLVEGVFADSEGLSDIRRLDELMARHEGANAAVFRVSHVEVFRFEATILRDAIRLWTSYHLDGSIGRALGRWESCLAPPDLAADRDLLADENEAGRAAGLWVWVAMLLNPALSGFHVRLEMRDVLGSDIGVPRPSLYSAMALQLANHIAEKAKYTPCAAEDCDRLFVRTEGYSRIGQNRLRGNKFCSERCANRQHQREFRRRKAAAKRGAGGTVPPDTSTEGSTP